MHRREHVVVIRSGRSGIVLHTMFYEGEVRREDEYRADTSQIAQKELDLAVLLVNSLKAPFEASKYRDGYRDKLDALIQAKLAGQASAPGQAPRLAPVVNIMEALQRSLDEMTSKPTTGQAPPQRNRRRPHVPDTPENGNRPRKAVRQQMQPSISECAVSAKDGGVGSSSDRV
jgi:DNA end-binding protein Ku